MESSILRLPTESRGVRGNRNDDSTGLQELFVVVPVLSPKSSTALGSLLLSEHMVSVYKIKGQTERQLRCLLDLMVYESGILRG